MRSKFPLDINFNNKTFCLIENSADGEASEKTRFDYKQDGDLVTADYYGGDIRYGKIIAELKGTKLHMLYQCITKNNELKAGKAVADIFIDEKKKIRLKLNWEWLTSNEKGISEYIEA